MDIVTAGRACVRRWYLFIPILVIGILATIHIANATKPTFESTGQFIVLGNATRTVTTNPAKTPAPRVTRSKGSPSTTPTPTPTPTPQPSTTVVNPYAGSGDLLRAALLAQMNGETFQTQLAKAGFKGSFTVAIAKKEPLFDVTADARHRKQASDLVNEVLSQADSQLRLVQVSAGAPDSDLQRAETLTAAATPSDVTSGKSKRLVAGIVITVAAALALSIALDSSMVALRRRRTAPAGVSPSTNEGAADPAPSNTTVVPADGRHVASRPSPVVGPAEEAPTEPAVAPAGDDSAKGPLGRLSRRGRNQGDSL